MIITKHAIERYRQRVRDCSPDEAERQLRALLPVSDEVARFRDGGRIFQVGSLRMVAVWDFVVTVVLVAGKGGDVGKARQKNTAAPAA